MSIKVTSDIEIEPEQINEDMDHIFSGIKSILENDEFGYFKSKAKSQIDQELEKYNKAIDTLLEKKSKIMSDNNNVSTTVESIRSQNKMNLEQLKERMNSNVG